MPRLLCHARQGDLLPFGKVFATFTDATRLSVCNFSNEAFGQGRGNNTALYTRLNPAVVLCKQAMKHSAPV